LDIRHESFVADPRQHLRELCGFLGVEPTPDYVEDCARIVYNSPHPSRREADWPRELIGAIRDRSKQFPFLAEYDFE
jgi:hypothetical protein